MEFGEHVRQAIGCEQCGGEGYTQTANQPGIHPTVVACPNEHVEVTLYNGTIVYADRRKCGWRCVLGETRSVCGAILDRVIAQGGQSQHAECGYQPRWDVINQEQTDA